MENDRSAPRSSRRARERLRLARGARWLLLLWPFGCFADEPPRAAYPASPFEIVFDTRSIRAHAPGSDNWAITWASNDHQYTTWGDGGGFGGTNRDGRVSLGVARVEGPREQYVGRNVWGGAVAEQPATFSGKSYGILALGDTLYLWRTGDASNESAFAFSELHVSEDGGRSWRSTGVRFDSDDFGDGRGFFAPTFLQFGRGYDGARDDFVYVYAPERQRRVWDVQTPGKIALLRVPRARIGDESAYECVAGFDGAGQPVWSAQLARRKPVFRDERNGAMRTSVSYNAGVRRYFLITQQVSRLRKGRGHIGIYESAEPWGPWRTVLFDDPWEIGLQTGDKTVFWNFSNKWLRGEGRDLVLVYTGPGSDEWGTIEGTLRERSAAAR